MKEKERKINDYESKLNALEMNSGKQQKELEKNFQGKIDEMNRRHDVEMSRQENKMDTLDSNIETLNQFKDTKAIREENLRKEGERYQRLKHELDRLKKDGKEQKELQKKKIEDTYAKNLEDFKAKA